MPTNQKPLSASKVNDTAETTAWNYPRNRCSASDPTASDDETLGFWYGSIWVNYATSAMFYCTTPDEGAAIWTLLANG